MKKVISVFFIFILFIVSTSVHAASCQMENFRTRSYDNYTRLVLDFSLKPIFTYRSSMEEDRTIIDLDVKNCTTKKGINIPKKFDSRIKSFSYVKLKGGVSRFKIELNKGNAYKIFELDNPNRIVVDLSSKSEKDGVVVSKENKDESKKITPKNNPDYSVKDELLRLAYSVFLQSNDLKNAHRTVKKALDKYPDSLYWHEEMAKVALWIGELDDAHKSMLFIYKNRKNRAKDFIKIFQSVAINVGDYATIAAIMKEDILNGNIEKIDEFIYLETELLGNIGEALDFLNTIYTNSSDKSLKRAVLKHMIQINYNMNEIDNAKYLISKYISSGLDLDAEVSIIASSIYFASKDYKNAFDVLMRYEPLASDNDTDFWGLLSDLAQFMNQREIALKASMILYKSNKFRDVDIQRIIDYTKDEVFKEKLLLEQWKKMGDPYSAYHYLNLLIKNKMYDKAIKFVKSVENDPKLISNVPFLLLKVNLYTYLNSYKDIKRTYLKIISLSDSSSIKESFLWAMISNKDKDIDKYIKKFSNELISNKNLHYIYAAYFSSIQKYRLSIYHIKEYIKYRGETHSILSLYADILQAAGEDELADNVRFKSYTLFLKESKTIPEFLLDKENVSLFLRLSIYYKSAEEFISLFNKYENYLTIEEKKDLHILFMLKNNHQEHADYLIRKYKYAQPWMLLNISLRFDSRDDISDILYKHISSLPTRDRVEAAMRIGEAYEALELAFEGLEENYSAYMANQSEVRSLDYELYKQYRDLVNQYANIFTFETSFGERGSLGYFTNLFELKQHLFKSIYMNVELGSGFISSKDKSNLINAPSTISFVIIEISKYLNEQSRVYLTFGGQDGLKTYNSFGTGVDIYVRNNMKLGLKYNYHIKSDDTTYLYLGGYKNQFLVDLRYNITAKNSISSSLTLNDFYSQDDKKIGSSRNIYAEYGFKLRDGYPDILWRSFVSYGDYKELSCNNCLIGKLSPYQNTAFLPEDFYELGFGITIGDINRYGYTRVWRPFMSATVSHSNVSNFNYSLGFGFGGQIFNQDHLSFIVNYGSNVKNSNDVSKEVKIIYRLWY